MLKDMRDWGPPALKNSLRVLKMSQQIRNCCLAKWARLDHFRMGKLGENGKFAQKEWPNCPCLLEKWRVWGEKGKNKVEKLNFSEI